MPRCRAMGEGRLLSSTHATTLSGTRHLINLHIKQSKDTTHRRDTVTPDLSNLSSIHGCVHARCRIRRHRTSRVYPRTGLPPTSPQHHRICLQKPRRRRAGDERVQDGATCSSPWNGAGGGAAPRPHVPRPAGARRQPVREEGPEASS